MFTVSGSNLIHLRLFLPTACSCWNTSLLHEKEQCTPPSDGVVPAGWGMSKDFDEGISLN
jgi:hypothetical protein